MLLLAPLSARAELDLAWDQLLKAAVNQGQVDYAQWRDNRRFDALTDQVAATVTDGMDRQQK